MQALEQEQELEQEQVEVEEALVFAPVEDSLQQGQDHSLVPERRSSCMGLLHIFPTEEADYWSRPNCSYFCLPVALHNTVLETLLP